MPRLLIVTTITDTIQSFLLPFAQHFRAQGWQVDALSAPGTAQWNWEDTLFDQVWEVNWSRNPLDTNNLIHPPRRVRDIVEQRQYDLVHVHTPVASFVTRFALRDWRRLCGRPVLIYTAHGFHFHPAGSLVRNTIFRTLEQVAGRWTDYLVVINREDETSAQQYAIVPPDRVWYMPGIGVDLRYYSPASVSDSAVAGVYAELELPTTTRLLLMVAEFIPRKRHADMIRAFARLNRPDTHLLLAGDGLLCEAMQQLAAELGVAQQVHFLGLRDDIPVLLRAAYTLILPSEQEGLPRSVLEALSMGTPVVGTRIRGMHGLLGEIDGFLVDVGDVEGLAQALRHLLDHPEEAQALSRRGQEHVQRYDVQRIITLHEELYTQALGQVQIPA